MAKKARKKTTPAEDVVGDAPIPDPSTIVTTAPPPIKPVVHSQEQVPEGILPLTRDRETGDLKVIGTQTGRFSGEEPNVSNPPKVAGTRCIYFQDKRDLHRLDELRERFPRASSASIINQLVTGFLKSLDDHHDSESREVPVVTTVYL